MTERRHEGKRSHWAKWGHLWIYFAFPIVLSAGVAIGVSSFFQVFVANLCEYMTT